VTHPCPKVKPAFSPGAAEASCRLLCLEHLHSLSSLVELPGKGDACQSTPEDYRIHWYTNSHGGLI